MERGVRLNGEDYCYYYSSGDGAIGVASSSTASPLPRVGGTAAATIDGTVGGGGMNYIEHHVTKFDTLAGVAIRYGVEVADVKRINGLVTDLQMFARKTLKIPLPGRHPPSPCMSNGFDPQGATPQNRRHSDLFDTFQSLKLKPPTQRRVSPAMNSLRGFYGLDPPPPPPQPDQKAASDGVEMGRLHRKCKSVANGFITENESNQETNTCDKSFRRRQKSETDFSRTQETLAAAGDSSVISPIPFVLGEDRVRKSSSASNLQESDSSSTLASLWPASKWSLTDFQALSTSIFDGLPKPISGRRNKAALD